MHWVFRMIIAVAVGSVLTSECGANVSSTSRDELMGFVSVAVYALLTGYYA